jgi:8-hydroxy-5-deazaflavin:NADPH oxidoreductase
MKIGIVGSGKMGLSLGKLWYGKRHDIFFSDISVEFARTAADSAGFNAQFGTLSQAASFADVLLLSIPYSSLRDVVGSISRLETIRNKTIIDCINPLSEDYNSLLIGHVTSVAEEISASFPKSLNVKVIKALNTIASPVFESGNTSFGNDKATMFYCGDDLDTKRTVSALIADLGFEPVDVGPLKNSRYLEPLAALIIQLAISQDMGTNIAIKLLKR